MKGSGTVVELAAKRFAITVLAILPAFLLQCRQDDTRADEPPPIEIKAAVHPAQSVTITSQIDGQVTAVNVRVGAMVAPNAPIAELSNPTVERDAAVARAQLDWVETRIRRGGAAAPRTVSHPRKSNSTDLTARIVELKRQRYEQMKQLARTKDITKAELENAEADYLGALRDYNDRRGLTGAVVTPASTDDVALLRIERDKTAAEEKFATQRKSLLTITSPIAGNVTRINVVPGQAINPRDPIAEVSDTSTLSVTGNVAPELLRYIRAGMPVQVKIFSVPPRTFADRIDHIMPVGSGTDARTATIVVSIPNPDRSLQPNTDALITLRTP